MLNSYVNTIFSQIYWDALLTQTAKNMAETRLTAAVGSTLPTSVPVPDGFTESVDGNHLVWTEDGPPGRIFVWNGMTAGGLGWTVDWRLVEGDLTALAIPDWADAGQAYAVGLPEPVALIEEAELAPVFVGVEADPEEPEIPGEPAGILAALNLQGTLAIVCLASEAEALRNTLVTAVVGIDP